MSKIANWDIHVYSAAIKMKLFVMTYRMSGSAADVKGKFLANNPHYSDCDVTARA